MDNTTRVVREIIAKIVKQEPADMSPELRLAEDLGMKSVRRIELAALPEDQLGVQIDNFEIRRPKTIADVLEMVCARQ